MRRPVRAALNIAIAGLLFGLAALPIQVSGRDRFQVEIYGGFSYMNLKDLNLLSKAEEQYNDIFFIRRLLGYQGYFINDFPAIRSAVPAGVRAKFLASKTLSFSVDFEGFRRAEQVSPTGTFSYTPSWTMTQTKTYDRFRIGLKAVSIMGGMHYRFPAGRATGLEVGAAAGWTRAEFDFRSAWTYSIDFTSGDFTHGSLDGGVLEGDGNGNGFSAKGMVRLSRSLGRRFGVFVEAAATYCRLNSISGGGRETRQGITEDTVWEGRWGIKKEEITTSWHSVIVSVPTNYWGGWTENQRDRDFILDLSGVRMVLGVYIKL